MAQLQQDNLFFDVQQQVCKILNDVPELSAIDFFPSNNKDLETEITTSLRKQGVCGIVIVDEANFQGFDSGIDTAWQIDNLVVQIIENPIINRASNNTNFLGTCQDIGTKVSQVLGGIEYGHHQVFNLKTYEEGEENGLLTSKISFQCLVTTNLSSYVPPEDPTQRIPFATEPWVISNFLPISAQVEPPSSYENLSVTNLSSEKIIIKEKGDNLVPIAIEQLSALQYPDKRFSKLYIYNISNDTSASWGSGYNNNYATEVYIGYNPKTRKCHTNYSGLYVPIIDTTRNIDNYLSDRNSVTTYQLNAKVTYTPTLLPAAKPYHYEEDGEHLWMIKNHLSVANLAIIDFPGYEKKYPAAIEFLSSEYSPYKFSLKNADFYRLKVLSNDVSGNLSVNNITGKNAYFDNLSGININIDDVINTDIYEDGSKMVSFPSKCQFGDDVTFKNSIQTSAITSEDAIFVDLSSDNGNIINIKNNYLTSDVITCNNSLYSNYIECNNITGNVINLIDQTSETGTTKGLLNTNEISAKTIYANKIGGENLFYDGTFTCLNIDGSVLTCSLINVPNMNKLDLNGGLAVMQESTFDSSVTVGGDLTVNGNLQASNFKPAKVTTDDIFTKDFTCEGDVDCNTITIGGVSLNSTQLNKLLALIS